MIGLSTALLNSFPCLCLIFLCTFGDWEMGIGRILGFEEVPVYIYYCVKLFHGGWAKGMSIFCTVSIVSIHNYRISSMICSWFFKRFKMATPVSVSPWYDCMVTLYVFSILSTFVCMITSYFICSHSNFITSASSVLIIFLLQYIEVFEVLTQFHTF